MNAIRAVVRNGRLETEEPVNLPDGMRVLVEALPEEVTIGLRESEWSDSPEALADWKSWIETIEPVDFPEPASFETEFERFNIEAVRRQMNGEPL
jgi:hypothetical protein